jgi:LPS sulfotransferase NodH
MILSTGRDGSTLLVDLLNNHPEIFCDPEIFLRREPVKLIFPGLYLRGRSKNAAKSNRSIYGFKLKIWQLNHDNFINNPEEFLKKMHKKGWSFIFLKRENLLKLALSTYVANKENIWEVKKNQNYSVRKIPVEIKSFLNTLRNVERVNQLNTNFFKNIPHLELIYERDLEDEANHQSTLNTVFNYLNIDSCKVKAGYKKKLKAPLYELIENYSEFYDYFTNTNYAGYLE